MSPLLSLAKAVPFWSGSQLKFTLPYLLNFLLTKTQIKKKKQTNIAIGKLQCLVEEGWHLATLFFLKRLGVACLRRPLLQCKQYCLMHCHPLLFVQCLESPVGKRKRSMTVSTSQDPSFSGLNQVWTVSYSNLNPKFMCFIFCFVFVLFFLIWRM